jgi:hypothetical protein
MRWLREKFFLDALELSFNAVDPLPRRSALQLIQLQCCHAGQPPMSTVHNREDHLQIADQLGARPG